MFVVNCRQDILPDDKKFEQIKQLETNTDLTLTCTSKVEQYWYNTFKKKVQENGELCCGVFFLQQLSNNIIYINKLTHSYS